MSTRTADDIQTEPIPRLALRPKEAAAALGISERALRQLAPELPRIERGGLVLYPVGPLQQWLRTEAQARGTLARKVVDSVMSELRSS